jgi:hypothetical protein
MRVTLKKRGKLIGYLAKLVLIGFICQSTPAICKNDVPDDQDYRTIKD